ncbi:MAG: hypothetical protein J6125_04990 [Clostridia bacterium]|nr:hypothetical protein [Clostridia bacterium]
MQNLSENRVEYRYRIELDTLADIRRFVGIAAGCHGRLRLCAGKDFEINAQSMLGVILAKKLDWNELTLVCDHDYYHEFCDFIVD